MGGMGAHVAATTMASRELAIFLSASASDFSAVTFSDHPISTFIFHHATAALAKTVALVARGTLGGEMRIPAASFSAS